jgi:hypothetical protein
MIWFVLVLVFFQLTHCGPVRIATCISGQSSRWQPHHIIENLFVPNRGRFHFFLFFNIQNSTVFNTDVGNTFSPSITSRFSYLETVNYINDLLQGSTAVIAQLEFTETISNKTFLRAFDVPALDRITQYTAVQSTILNMYSHQVKCIRQLLKYEAQNNLTFDFIISTREDVFFFRPLNLSTILPGLRSNLSDFSSKNKCDIFFKRCRNFWGFNMRFYILSREVGIKFLGNRFSFYKYLYSINRTIENPERFELSEATALKLIGCPVPVENFPITAIRHFQNGQLCFVWFEIDRCVPQDFHEFSRNHMCNELKRAHFLDLIFSEYPELIKANFVVGIGNSSLSEEVRSVRSNIDFNNFRDTKALNMKKKAMSFISKPRVPLQRLLQNPWYVDNSWTDRDY